MDDESSVGWEQEGPWLRAVLYACAEAIGMPKCQFHQLPEMIRDVRSDQEHYAWALREIGAELGCNYGPDSAPPSVELLEKIKKLKKWITRGPERRNNEP